MFTKIRSKTSCYWIPCLFMNWDLLFDFLFKFENLSTYKTYLIRTEKTSQQRHIWHVVGSVHLCAFMCISQAKNDPRKRTPETFWNLERSKMDGFWDSRPQSLKAWSELLSKVGHHVAQLCSTDEAVAIAIEDLEGLNQFLFSVSVLQVVTLQESSSVHTADTGDTGRFKTWVWQPTYIPTSTHSKCDGR